ncbi:MAG: response regulator [Victivallaceae bacterium]|nr:response regulator [Victivallaceae bacterium]
MECKALVIDDDDGICVAVAARLDLLEHKCDCAHSVKEAKELLRMNKYNYIILDMEIPLDFGKTPELSIGANFLKVLRASFSREEMPILIITAHSERQSRLASNVIFNGATDFILKPLETEGEHTLETSIARFVGIGDQIITGNEEQEDWLSRTPKGGMMSWKTIAKDGHVREYLLGASSMRCSLLDCIFFLHKKSPVICHQDIMDKVGWKSKAYYAKEGGAPRGPLKGHVAALRKMLGMNIAYIEHGIKVTRPED